MRSTLGLGLAITLAAAAPTETISAQTTPVANVAAAQYTAEELENLLAPVALYPDPILAQVLVAASYPDEVELAARHVGIYGQSRIDEQPWDISVRAVAHYAPVLNLMADRIDWTTALGQAYAEQPADVMDAVQSLRAMARAHGNLVTTREQEVVVRDRHIHIVPARPQVVYVPVYDPLVVYHRPIVHLGVYDRGWSFGIAFPIGAWLTYDVDWGHRYVYYHGWDRHRHRHGWYHRSRPYVVINHIYVQPRPTIVVVNRTVIHRRVNWDRFDRYNYVHRRVAWERHRRYDDGRRVAGGGPSWDRDRRDDRDDAPRYDRKEAPRYDGGGRNDRGNAPRADRQQVAPRNPSWDRSGRGNAASPGNRGNGSTAADRGNAGQRGRSAAATPPRTRVAAAPPSTSARRTDAGRYQPRGGGSTVDRSGAASTRRDRSVTTRAATERSSARPAPSASRPAPSVARSSPPRMQRSAPQPRAQSAPSRSSASAPSRASSSRASSSRGSASAPRAAKAKSSESRGRRAN